MNILKRILNYFIWTIIALLLAFVYMYIILGSKPESSSILMAMFGWLYEYAFIIIGLIIGSIIAFLFVLADVFYLDKRLKNNVKSTLIRLLIIILFAIIICITHHIIEKVVDVI
jgi:hypothetical protein